MERCVLNITRKDNIRNKVIGSKTQICSAKFIAKSTSGPRQDTFYDQKPIDGQTELYSGHQE